MKSSIYYFSGTGNSLAVARQLAGVLDSCELVPVAQTMVDERLLTCTSKTVGLVVPLYYGGLPKIVAEFLGKVTFTGVEYVFVVITAGHDLGTGIAEANGILGKKGLRVSYWTCPGLVDTEKGII